MTSLMEIYNEWQNNFQFREAFKKNPEAALKAAGFEVSDEDLIKIQSMIAKSANEELDKRETK